jgi:hypothetical protein
MFLSKQIGFHLEYILGKRWSNKAPEGPSATPLHTYGKCFLLPIVDSWVDLTLRLRQKYRHVPLYFSRVIAIIIATHLLFGRIRVSTYPRIRVIKSFTREVLSNSDIMRISKKY